MIRAFLFVAMISLGIVSAVLPRIAQATPGKDACNGMLEWSAQYQSIDVYAPGTWCLDHDIVVGDDFIDASFMMIAIQMNDTTIDCRGHLLEYTGTASFSYAIGPRDATARITVRNCRFRGFSTAIYLADGDDNLVEDNVILSSRMDAVGEGSAINGYGRSTVRRNRVFDSIGNAIKVGKDSTIADNLVDGIQPSDYDQVRAIEVFYPDGAEVRGNTVRGLPQGSNPSQYIAIVVENADHGDGARSLIADNVIVHDSSEGDIGIFCNGKARVADNVINGFWSPTAFCNDIGDDNDISP